jgi:hypothetical protein
VLLVAAAGELERFAQAAIAILRAVTDAVLLDQAVDLVVDRFANLSR